MDELGDELSNEAIRKWINHILAAKGWPALRLAREAAVSPSTISRALNDDRFVLSTRTLNKIRNAIEINEYKPPLSREKVSSILELNPMHEGGFFSRDTMTEAFNELVNANLVFFLYTARNLELIGINSDDILAFDLKLPPKRGDIVLVSTKHPDGSERDVIRYYDPPYLLTKHLYPEHDAKPLVADGEAVQIKGPAVSLLRGLAVFLFQD